MDVNQFREFGKAAIDYIADYYESLRERSVLPDVEPGYIRNILPDEAPQEGDSWQNLLKDFERIILSGLTHWQSPHYYAYYPASYSFPSIIGELMSTGLGVVGINWITGPVITELEVLMMNWLGKMLDLPSEFLNCSEGPGGGIIKGTASEATLVCLIAAKERTIKRIKGIRPELSEAEIRNKLVCYSSDQSNSSVEKAGLLGSLTVRLLESDEEGRLIPNSLFQAINSDCKYGFFPCYVVATLGTTGTCAFDNLMEIGPICQNTGIWLHVDAAYAGTAFVCPEYRYLNKGVEYADSFNFNLHKFMLVHFDCSALWVKNSQHLMEAFTVERQYLKHVFHDTAPEYLHWQIPLGRRFRSLKVYFMLQTYGVEGVQRHVRKQISLANYFAELIRNHANFELCFVRMALVCFRVKESDLLTKQLVSALTEKKEIYVIAYTYKNKTVIRLSINSNETTELDLEYALKEMNTQLNSLLNNNSKAVKEKEPTIHHKGTVFKVDLKSLNLKETRT